MPQGTSGCDELKAQAAVEAPPSESVLIRQEPPVTAGSTPAGDGERVVYAETFEL